MDRVLVAHLLCHTSGLDGAADGAAGAPEASGRVMVPCRRDYELLGAILERVGGDAIDALARSRLFEPLGMSHTELAAQGASIEASSTAGDLAAFLQMLLSRGRCGDTAVLSRASVEAMRRNQTEGLEVVLPGGFRQRASHYGFGFWGESDDRLPWSGGTLQSASSVRHQDGDVFFWADPENDLIGVWLGEGGQETATSPFGPAPSDADLFQNVVSAAVLDCAGASALTLGSNLPLARSGVEGPIP
jgi:CubicO group peptidase (beta-lactamase class C family)